MLVVPVVVRVGVADVVGVDDVAEVVWLVVCVVDVGVLVAVVVWLVVCVVVPLGAQGKLQ